VAKRGDWEGRANNFDFLRLALAVLVIYSHSFPLGTGSEAAEPILRLTHGQMTGGAISVDLFFVMSGFLIAASAERSKSLFGFLKKRVARIYPAFCVAGLLTAIVVLPLASGTFVYPTMSARIGDFLLQTLRLREFHYAVAFTENPYPNAINGSTWSIQYEFWCYLGVALMSLAGLMRRRVLVLALFVASLAVSVCFEVKGWILGGKLLGVILGPPQIWARLLPLYLAGVVFYLFRERIPKRGWIAAACLAALVPATLLRFGCVVIFPLAGTYLVFYLAYTSSLKLHRAVRFGDFSYGTYLYAFPVQQMVMKGLGHPVSPILLFACATPPTLLLAVASWYGVERWFLRPARRKETIVRAIAASHEHQGTGVATGKREA
jgi:peptidoglycan/LPS O-acetylase OafA/YrhL